MDCHKDHVCKCPSTSCMQTIDEMEFERGIWYAAQSGDIDRVRKLLTHGVDKLDQAGYTALHYAARSGHVEICKLLLSSGASVNKRTRSGLATPLHRAATSGKFDIIKLLIENGADLKLQDSDGQTPLHRAAAGGHFNIVKLMLSSDGTSLSVQDNRGRLPRDLALVSTSDNNFLQLFN